MSAVQRKGIAKRSIATRVSRSCYCEIQDIAVHRMLSKTLPLLSAGGSERGITEHASAPPDPAVAFALSHSRIQTKPGKCLVTDLENLNAHPRFRVH